MLKIEQKIKINKKIWLPRDAGFDFDFNNMVGIIKGVGEKSSWDQKTYYPVKILGFPYYSNENTLEDDLSRPEHYVPLDAITPFPTKPKNLPTWW